jgi:7,8-dihydropterin-6-yl-methyl-4-(beta-D-ribofuranosyl)aminobenzene 5'-phosphate synthase
MSKILRISKETMPSVENLRITVLVEDSTSMERPDLIAKQGLSFLIETSVAGSDSRILMDTGPPPDIALRNAETIDVEMRKLDAIVISHGHDDHAGGLLKILERVGQPTLVIAHPRALDPKFEKPGRKRGLKYVGAGFDQISIRAAGGVPLIANNPVSIVDGVVTSGEVTRETTFEKVEGFWTVEDERFIEDSIIDDQALLINIQGRGLVIVTGCTHSGIVNMIRHAQKVTGMSEVYAIVGGLHLTKASDDRIRATIEELARINPVSIYPCHCTGSEVTYRLLNSFGDRCRPIRTGDTLEFQS